MPFCLFFNYENYGTMTSIKKSTQFKMLLVECAGNPVVEKYRVNTEQKSADASAACTSKYSSYAV